MEDPRQRDVGPYRLDALLGKGGMGEVYKAWDRRLERWVALKRLHADLETEPSARARFLREARAVARLGHPAIVQIFDVVENGDAWIVMELVPGPTLDELLAEGPLDVGLAIEYGRQIGFGLDAAHRKGVIHRDLKPKNVMVLPTDDAHPGLIKILDFGLARRISPSDSVATTRRGGDLSSLSRAGEIVGTLPFMSPEQAQGIEVDTRSDLFSFGVLLYVLATKRSPFHGSTPAATLARVISHHQPPAHQLNPRIPRRLSELIDRLLEKDPELRPETAVAVAEELTRIAAASPLFRASPASGYRFQETLPALAISPEARQPIEEVAVKTLVILDQEVAGISEMATSDEDVTLLTNHDLRIRELLVDHGGRQVRRIDVEPAVAERKRSWLLFHRPWSAIRFCLKYQEVALSTKVDVSDPETTRRPRLAIHVGEIILREDRRQDADGWLSVEGLGPPILTRLSSVARAGQILLTRAAFEVGRREADGTDGGAVRWLAHGRYCFKGLGEDVEVFEVGITGVAPQKPPRSTPEAALVAPESSREPDADGRLEPGGAVTLRDWPPPELPELPYPVLLPYTHPALLAGREQEIADLLRRLRMPIPLLGLCAPSGAGKSSLLLGGLLPSLRSESKPVAMIRHPHEKGLAKRLIGDLLTPLRSPGSGIRGFLDGLLDVERLAGEAPTLILDQFEEVLRPDAFRARAVLGPLLAATARRRSGIETPICRWLLAYRQEFHGAVLAWLGDVLIDARASSQDGPGNPIDALPHDLSQPDRFHCTNLLPLARPALRSDPADKDPLSEVTKVFLSAIEKPLTAASDGGKRRFPWRFEPGAAERLASTFAQARQRQPEAALTPELQAVLAHLLAQTPAGEPIAVPEDPGPLIEEALADHLHRALEAAFPITVTDFRSRRARALLALRELATTGGQRGEGIEAGALARAIGNRGDAVDGQRILEKLSTPWTRLVVLQDFPGGLRYVLAHDRMAEVIVRLAEAEGRHGNLLVDAELLGLRRFITLKMALFRSREEQATRLPKRHYRRIEANTQALLWDDEGHAWWAACRNRLRIDRRRQRSVLGIALILLTLVAWGAWTLTREWSERNKRRQGVVKKAPIHALKDLTWLENEGRANPEELLELLRRRKVPMDILALGLDGVPKEERAALVLRLVALALPWVEETPQDRELVANLVWALDFAPGREPLLVERARGLRNLVLRPLRRLHGQPPLPEPGNREWIDIPGGTFLMGTAEDGAGNDNERPRHEVTVSPFRMLRHEVTNAEYRLLVSDHFGDDDQPAVRMSWHGAYTYAAWLGGRLPTEAEWEYAARAGCPYEYCDRDGLETTVDEVAWTLRNARDPETPAVMQREPNPWGLFDMLGNRWEWTADWYGDYPAMPQRDPWGPVAPAPLAPIKRVDRGGCYGVTALAARVAFRFGNPVNDVTAFQGLRVVLPSHAAEEDELSLGLPER